MDDSDLAPLKEIPSDSFLCVEYPGYVKNIDKVLETLGGVEKVSTVLYNSIL